MLRELSDGFQYTEVVTGQQQCPNCLGKKETLVPVPVEEVDTLKPLEVGEFVESMEKCIFCDGKGTVPVYERSTIDIGTPKDEILIETLDEHDDVGRLVIFAGFTASVDRIESICHQYGWSTLKIDGRGLIGTDAQSKDELDIDELQNAMDRSHPDFESLREKYPKLCIVGNSEAAGMAYTFHASPTILYYSNSFKGEARIQSEDRIHRTGMDENRACRIIDLFHLASDKLVYDNVKKKRDLLNITMGALDKAFEHE